MTMKSKQNIKRQMAEVQGGERDMAWLVCVCKISWGCCHTTQPFASVFCRCFATISSHIQSFQVPTIVFLSLGCLLLRLKNAVLCFSLTYPIFSHLLSHTWPLSFFFGPYSLLVELWFHKTLSWTTWTASKSETSSPSFYSHLSSCFLILSFQLDVISTKVNQHLVERSLSWFPMFSQVYKRHQN